MTEVLGGLAADVADRLALDLAPLREVGPGARGWGRTGAWRGLAAACERLPHETLHVVHGDPSARASAGHLADLDTKLARDPAHGRRGRRGHAGAGLRGRCGRRRRLRSVARRASDVDDLAAL